MSYPKPLPLDDKYRCTDTRNGLRCQLYAGHDPQEHYAMVEEPPMPLYAWWTPWQDNTTEATSAGRQRWAPSFPRVER